MSYLSLYFLIKTGLYYSHYIGFNWGLNFLLALVVFWPLTPRRWRQARSLLAWPVALALAYHESYLPTPARIWSQVDALRGFSNDYVLELLVRVINPVALGALAVAVVIYAILSRWLRFSSFAFASILSVPLVAAFSAGSVNVLTASSGMVAGAASGVPAAAVVASDPETQLKAFYATESQRLLVFPKLLSPPSFDIVILHVCSLAWDDLDFVNERNAPLLKRFDVLFRHFNSGASYNGPASIRILRGTCGQPSHSALYKGDQEQCKTFPSLAKAGYKTQGLLNHNGIFDHFAKIVAYESGLEGQLIANQAAPQTMKSFDGTPVYDDYALLSKWWVKRQASASGPVALYYNTISLHDGNRVPGLASVKSLETYKPRLEKLFSDFDRFISDLEATGKPVVVMLVPEHGAALRGDKMQISGMREIPDSKITLVPAAIKLVGMKTVAVNAAPIVVDQQISYFGLFTLLGNLMADSPYVPDARPLAQRLDTLETTRYVAENGDVVVMRDSAGRYVMKSADGTWLPYDMN